MSHAVCPYEEEDLLAATLGETVAADMQSHLDGCPRCRQRLVQLKSEAQLLRQAVRGLTPTPSASPGPSPSPPGQRAPGMIGKYFVVGMLGQGAQAVVYRALHPELNKELVIKLSKEAAYPEERELLAREARLLADLEHPNLARVYDLDWHEGRPFLVMDYVRGVDLEQYAVQEKPTPRHGASLVAQLARAVAAAHQRGVIHQDIKPGNIVLDEFGRPRLLDFGLARLRDAWSAGTEQPRGGTLAFMAPEQARGETAMVGPASDIFALGAVLYFLVTGKPPFVAGDAGDARARAGRCEFDRAALRGKGIPGRLAALCLRAMAADPGARHSRAELLAADLDRCLRRPRWTWPLAALAAVLAAAAGLWCLWPKASGPVFPATPQPLVKVLQRTVQGKEQIFTPDTPHGLMRLAPLRVGDKLEFGCDVPRGCQAALFYLDTNGVLRELTPLHVSPAGAFDHVRYPTKGVEPVQGPPGTMVVFVCANRQDKPRLDEVEVLFEDIGDRSQRGSAALPALVEQIVFLLNPEEVQTVGLVPRDPVDTPFSQVRDRLERMRARLRERFDYVCGVALPQR